MHLLEGKVAGIETTLEIILFKVPFKNTIP